jgi:hypothetical protein
MDFLQVNAPKKEIYLSPQVGNLNIRVYINLLESFLRYARDVENKETKRSNVDCKVLREGRDMKMLLVQKKTNPQKKGMCTFLLQSHMQIMRHGYLTHVHPFICFPKRSGYVNMKGTMEVMFSYLMN